MKDVLALAVQNTYDLVVETGVTAHPATSRYPVWKPDFVVPIMAGGHVSELFSVEVIFACDVHGDLGDVFGLTEEQIGRINDYKAKRLDTFGFSHAETPYRFYLLRKVADVISPGSIKYIQVSKKMSLEEFHLSTSLAEAKKSTLSDVASLAQESVVTGHKEGAQIQVYSTKYERSASNRVAAIKAHGLKCQACGFDFGSTYGEIGADFIEVHHAKPLCTLYEETIPDPVEDLVCLCSNCHRMVHRKRNTVLSLDELKEIIENNKKQ